MSDDVYDHPLRPEFAHPGHTENIFLKSAAESAMAFHEACEVLLACEYCGTSHDLKIHSSRTSYHDEGKGEDPNRDRILCEPCAEGHHEYWNEMWESYWSQLL